MGGEAFSLRANAKNFSLEKMKEAVDYAHERGVKVYVTANILAHNADLLPMREYFSELKEVGDGCGIDCGSGSLPFGEGNDAGSGDSYFHSGQQYQL